MEQQVPVSSKLQCFLKVLIHLERACVQCRPHICTTRPFSLILSSQRRVLCVPGLEKVNSVRCQGRLNAVFVQGVW